MHANEHTALKRLGGNFTCQKRVALALFTGLYLKKVKLLSTSENQA